MSATITYYNNHAAQFVDSTVSVDLTEMQDKFLRKLNKNVPEPSIEEYWITYDARPGRGDEKWLNLILTTQFGGYCV